MLLTDQDPTKTCAVSPVTDPSELDRKRNAQENIFLDRSSAPERGPDAVVIGHYQLQAQLGKGSSGVVWKALDLGAVRREVALKILHADYQDEHARIRFTNEVRALACLDDPHIAKVWDNGQTKDGRLFLAMELVNGLSLLKYCDTWSLSVRERLELVIKICEGIQHAHQRAILHRDLKPANILVALVDGQPVPKVIDFGLAKSMQGPLAPAAIETTQRGCLIGTIGYMSPEQAELDQRDVDVRSDVYAISAILYEMLTGTLPIPREHLHRHSLTDALKLVREREPDLPSARVLLEPGASLHAARCRLSDEALAQTLRGDLDAILMKGLAKDRFQRYQSAAELAEDLKRYLHGGVVQARKRTYWYVTQKMVRKHWKAAAVLAAVVTLVLSSWALTIIGYFSVLAERDRAEQALKKAIIAKTREDGALTDAYTTVWFFQDLIEKMLPSRSGSHVTLADVIDKSVDQLQRITSQPRPSCLLRTYLAKTYLRYNRPAMAEELLRPVLKTRFDVDADQTRFAAPVQEAYINTLLELERYQLALDCAHAFLDEFPPHGDQVYVGVRKDVRWHMARALAGLNRFQDAYDYIESMIPKPVLAPNEYIFKHRLVQLNLLLRWKDVDPTKLDAAQELAMKILPEAPNLYRYHIQLNLVTILKERKQFTQALDLLDDLVDFARANPKIWDNPELNAPIILDVNRAQVHLLNGDQDEAQRLCESTLEKAKKRFSPDHDVTQLTLESLIEVHVARGRYWKALDLYRSVTTVADPLDEDLSNAERQVRRDYQKTLSKAALQWALWSVR